MGSGNNSAPSGLPGLAYLLIAVIGVGGIAIFNSPKSSDSNVSGKSKPAPEKDEKAKTSDPADPDPLSVLTEFFRLEPRPKAGTPEATLAEKLGKGKSQFKFEFLIACVPDPADSKFAFEFDSTIEAIQRAFEAQGFLLHTSWLPWPRTKGEAPKTGPPLHRELPGTMLFRGKRGDSETLSLVCLIGENPISGPQKPALAAALAIHKRLVDAGVGWSAKHDKEIRIVGPYYSGSLVRVVRTVDTWNKQNGEKYRFSVISGSATALKPEDFRDFPGTIQATVIPDRLASKAILDYLEGGRGTRLDEHSKRPARIAVLRESNTAFGANAKQSPATQVIDLPFPASISQLMANEEKDKDKSAKPWDGLPKDDFDSKLPIRSGTQVDGFTPYDADSAATVAEQSLRASLSTIQAAKIEFVQIVATDARDIVFLNKKLRKECPQVRVFTTEPNIAFTQPDEAYHLRGMLVGSTYPLNASVSWWTTPREKSAGSRQISFPSQGSQGYYNAVIAHAPEDLHRLLIGYQAPFERFDTMSNRPAIWISTVGQRGTMVPVHFYRDYDDAGYVFQPHAAGTNTELPRGLQVPFLHLIVQFGTILLLLAVIASLAWSRSDVVPPAATRPTPSNIVDQFEYCVSDLLASARASATNWWVKWFLGRTPHEIDVAKLPPAAAVWEWRIAIFLSVLLFAIPGTLPARELVGGMWPEMTFQWRYYAAILMACASLGLIFLIIGLLFWRSGPGSQHPGEGPRGYRVAGVLAFIAVAAAWIWWCDRPVHERFLLYWRCANFQAGMSPLVPMGLLALAGLAVAGFNLGQADIARRDWLKCPHYDPKKPEEAGWRDVKAADEELNANCNSPLPTGIWMLAPVAVAAAAWYYIARALPSGEGSTWDISMRIAFWGCVAAVVLSLVRFLELWAGLRRLLGEIIRVPMVGAFERLPDEIGRIFGSYLYAQRPRHSHLAAAAWMLPPDDRKKLAGEIEADHPALSWVFGHAKDAANAKPVEDDDKWLAERLESFSRDYLAKLPKLWEGRSVNDAFGVSQRSEARKDEKEKPDAETDRLLRMEQYLAAFIVLYLGRYFAQLRKLVFAFSMPSALLLFAAASYPFQPDRPYLYALVGLLIAAVAGIMYTLYGINRDGLISRITRTTPDRFTPDSGFISSVAKYVLPLVALLFAHVLGLFRFVLEPVFGLFQ